MLVPIHGFLRAPKTRGRRNLDTHQEDPFHRFHPKFVPDVPLRFFGATCFGFLSLQPPSLLAHGTTNPESSGLTFTDESINSQSHPFLLHISRVMESQQLVCGNGVVVRSSLSTPQGISLREPRVEDLEELSKMAYQTYADFNKSVGIPIEVAYDSPEAAWRMLHAFVTSSSIIGVLAVEDSSGALMGAAFATIGEVSGVGPVFVDPTRQSKGVGKAIMLELIKKAKGFNTRSIRLSQSAANTASFSMYANIGFIPVEGWMEFAGIVTPENAVIANSSVGFSPLTGAKVCRMEEKDIPACAKLYLQTVGYDRDEDLRESHQKGCSMWVVTQNDDIVAYTTGLNLLGHAIAKTEEALVFLFMEVSQQHKSGRLPAVHVAGRLYPRLVQWFLAAKLKVLRLQWYMVMGFYQAPENGMVWCPGGQH